MIAAIYRHETGVSVIDDWDGFGQRQRAAYFKSTSGAFASLAPYSI